MRGNDLATRVINGIQGNPEAVKAVADALAGGDPAAIQEAISKHAGVEISAEEAQTIAEQVKANPSQPAAYGT
jgi:hypothetical protein